MSKQNLFVLRYVKLKKRNYIILANQEDLNDQLSNHISINEIGLNDFSDFILRNKKLIIKFLIGGISFSFFLLFVLPRTWKGEFQIVIDQEESLFPKSLSTNNEILVELANNNNKNNLKTQIGILKSPSVLLSVYEFVKAQKNYSERYSKNFEFNDWKKNINFYNEKGTSILNISYKDKEKNLILPVLNKISNSYQKYSLKRRKRDLELISDYLKEQISIFEKKTFNSIREAQQFAIDENLTILDEAELDKEIPNALNIEQIRLAAASKIKENSFILEQIKLMGNDPKALISIARSIDPSNNELFQLEKIQNEISFNSKFYKEYELKRLKVQRSILIKILKSKLISILNTDNLLAESQLKASERPKGVVLKYKLLLNKAAEDKETFSELNRQYRYLNLEMAKTSDPWELITSPNLFDKVDSPKKKRFIFIGLLLGLFSGIIFSFYKEQKEDLIKSEKQFNKEVKVKFLRTIDVNNKESFLENITLISKSIFSKIEGNIGFLIIDQINQKYTDQLIKEFRNKNTKQKYYFCKNIVDSLNYQNIILIAELGITKRSEFYEIKEKLIIQKKNFLGVILLSK